jgi:hypothetical protein
MKNLLSFLIVCFACLACTDAVDLTSISKDLDNRNATVSPQGTIISPTDIYRWTELPTSSMPSPDGDYDYSGETFKVNGNVYSVVGGAEENTYKFNKSTKLWEPYPIDLTQFFDRFRYIFSYSSYIYGLDDDNLLGRININTGQFHLMTSTFPGPWSVGNSTFTIGNQGYVLGGRTMATYVSINRFWKYDFLHDTWTDMGELPGGARTSGRAFAIGDKVYYGLGWQTQTINNEKIIKYKNDWMVFDPSIINSGNVYPQQANFPGTKRAGAKGFVIDGKIYVGWGIAQSGGSLKDFWQFNPATNRWTEKPYPENSTLNDPFIEAFSVGNVGYVIGYARCFWQYSNPMGVNLP